MHPPLGPFRLDRAGLTIGGCVFAIGFWRAQDGQDVAEYAVMTAVVLVIVIGTVRLIAVNSGHVFSSVGSTIR